MTLCDKRGNLGLACIGYVVEVAVLLIYLLTHISTYMFREYY